MKKEMIKQYIKEEVSKGNLAIAKKLWGYCTQLIEKIEKRDRTEANHKYYLKRKSYNLNNNEKARLSLKDVRESPKEEKIKSENTKQDLNIF